MLSAAFVVAAANTHAQPYASKPIRIVVAYPPGCGTDVMARVVAKQLGSSLGQPIVIENRGGANATIGTNNVAKSTPDGYSLTVVSGTPFVMNQVVFKDLPYNVLTGFEPIGLFTNQPLLLLLDHAVGVTVERQLHDRASGLLVALLAPRLRGMVRAPAKTAFEHAPKKENRWNTLIR